VKLGKFIIAKIYLVFILHYLYTKRVYYVCLKLFFWQKRLSDKIIKNF